MGAASFDYLRADSVGAAVLTFFLQREPQGWGSPPNRRTPLGEPVRNVPFTPPVAAADPVRWTDVLGAIGPLVAAVVAIWIAWWGSHRDRRSRPRLMVHFDPESREDYVVDTPSESDEGGLTHYVRLRVSNARGRRTAEEVEALLVGVQSDSQADAIVRTQPLEGYSFRWATVAPAGHEPVTKLSIPPGASRHFDLLRLTRPMVPRPAPDGASALAALTVEPMPPALSHALSGGFYLVFILVTARDIDAKYIVAEVRYDGSWHEGPAIRRGLAVRVFEGERDPLPPVRRLWESWPRRRLRRAAWWIGGGWRAGWAGRLSPSGDDDA